MPTMKNTRSISVFLRRNGAALLCTAGLYILMYQVVYGFRLSSGHLSDYNAHMLWALGLRGKDVLASFYDGSIRLWHICVKYVFELFLHNTWKATAAVTAAADAAAYFLLFKIWDRALEEKFPRWALAILCASVFFVNGLMLPGGAFYIKNDVVQSAVNTWHNPTNIMVRPFALAVFYMTVNIYNRRLYGRDCILPPPESENRFSFEGGFRQQFRRPVFTRKELALYPLCVLFSAYAKPSFLQFFCPAIFVLLVIDVIRTKGMLLPFAVKLAVPYLPAAAIVLRQFRYAFNQGVIDSGQVVEAVESSVTGGPHGVQIYLSQEGAFTLSGLLSQAAQWLPLLLFCALPIFLLAIDPKRGFGGAVTRLGFLCAVAGRLEAVVFHETGSRATHGNFLWGFSLAAWVFWTAAIGRYAELLPSKTTAGKLARYGGTALLAWHLAVGVAYVVLILRTHDYLY